MFKVGDKLYWKYDDGRIDTDVVYTVNSISKYGMIIEWRNGTQYYSSFNNFVLVEGEEQSSDYLDTLIRKANEGMEAYTQIKREYQAQVEKRVGGGENWQKILINRNYEPTVYRRIVKPVFTPYKTDTTNYQVSLHGDDLKVGCSTFPAKEIYAGLNDLINKQQSAYNFNNIKLGQLRASRNLVLNRDRAITWEEADVLLAKLEEAGYGKEVECKKVPGHLKKQFDVDDNRY